MQRPSTESLRRYDTFWLPLVASLDPDTKNEPLVPPLDIAWVWHCHRLAPDAYERACMSRFGRLLDNPEAAFQFQSEQQTEEGEDSTRRLWEERYPEEPFFIPLDPSPGHDEKNTEHDGIIEGFDVAGSAERQATFLWQVSGPRYREEAFLQEAVLNYGRFLRLMRLNPGAFLVPTYQVS